MKLADRSGGVDILMVELFACAFGDLSEDNTSQIPGLMSMFYTVTSVVHV